MKGANGVSMLQAGKTQREHMHDRYREWAEDAFVWAQSCKNGERKPGKTKAQTQINKDASFVSVQITAGCREPAA